MSSALPHLDRLVPGYIQKIEPYLPSRPDDVLRRMYDCPYLYRLNNNENALGPSPLAIAAIKTFEPVQAALYPNGDAWHLRHQLALKFNHPADCFLVGNGANEVITFVIKAFCQAGDNIITTDRTFAVYEWVAEFSGHEARLVPLTADYRFDAEGILHAVDERTKIIFICNPNNPTGTYWNTEELRRFLDVVDGKQIVVLDEAYGEFVEAADYPDGMELLREYSNLVVFRTFSKMFALAALRIGYLAGQKEVVNIIRRACVVYSVNTLAQVAARGALADAEHHIERTRRMVREARAFLHKELTDLKLDHTLGEGNFMMVRLPLSDTLAYRRLMQQGIMVRTMTGFRFPNHIRVTLGTLPAMEKFVEALKQAMG